MVHHRRTAVVLLLLMFGLAVHNLTRQSPTFDEQGFLVRGLAYVRNENRRMRVGHPAGLNVWNALLLWGDASVRLPTTDPSWQTTEFHRPAELFLWEIGNNVERIMFLGRLPTVWLGLLLAAVVGRFARDVTGSAGPTLAALAFVALDPNILAHGGLATTDLGLVTAAVAATWTLWRLLVRPQLDRALLAGACFGLLQNTKFTAGLFLPLLAAVALIGLGSWARRAGWPAARRLLFLLAVVYPAAAFLTLWACYGFQIGRLPDELPALSALLGGRTLPLSHHIEQLSDLGGRMAKATPAFLLGRYSDSGWWTYFPIALLLKTPLPTLLAGLAGLTVLLWRAAVGRFSAVTVAALAVPPLGFFAIALTNDINIGYRHILVMVPFLALWAAIGLAGARRRSADRPWIWRTAVAICFGWLGWSALSTSPHLPSYFNELAGGPDNGWRALVDSNIDWGQDLANLAHWQHEQSDAAPLYLSYFGEGRPDYYGIAYIGLPSFPPRLMDPNARPFNPADPAPGRYAISATNLQGVLFDDHDLFAWFRVREPFAKIGYSIFLYDVAPTGPPVTLSLGSVQIDQLPTAVQAQFASNDLRLRWFDAAHALLLPTAPAGEDAWIVLPAPALQTEPFGRLAAGWGAPGAADGGYVALRRRSESTTAAVLATAAALPGWTPATAVFWQGDGALRLHGYTVTRTADALIVTTLWEQAGASRPAHLFVHLTNSDDEIVAQWDGFGAHSHNRQPGDLMAQNATLPLPTVDPPAGGRLWIGLYDPAGGARWLFDGPDGSADRLLLTELSRP